MFYDDKQMREYFESLPKAIQENLVQSGAKALNVEQLKKLVSEIESKHTSG